MDAACEYAGASVGMMVHLLANVTPACAGVHAFSDMSRANAAAVFGGCVYKSVGFFVGAYRGPHAPPAGGLSARRRAPPEPPESSALLAWFICARAFRRHCEPHGDLTVSRKHGKKPLRRPAKLGGDGTAEFTIPTESDTLSKHGLARGWIPTCRLALGL